MTEGLGKELRELWGASGTEDEELLVLGGEAEAECLVMLRDAGGVTLQSLPSRALPLRDTDLKPLEPVALTGRLLLLLLLLLLPLLLLLVLWLLLRMLCEEEEEEEDDDAVAERLWLVVSPELLLLPLELALSLVFSAPIGTRGGMSFGGIVLKPGLESRPDSPLDPLLPREEGLFSCSAFSAASLSFLSNGGMMGFDGDGSLPILLHV